MSDQFNELPDLKVLADGHGEPMVVVPKLDGTTTTIPLGKLLTDFAKIITTMRSEQEELDEALTITIEHVNSLYAISRGKAKAH